MTRVPGPYDQCARCGSWHYTHGTGHAARFCREFVDAITPASAPVVIAAVDPGGHGSGFCLLGPDGRLELAAFVRGPGHEQPNALPALPALWLSRAPGAPGATVQAPAGPARLVIEQPQVYTRDKSPGDPGDLIAVACTAGAWARAGACLGYRPEYVRPAAWKGQTPKDVTRARALEVLEDFEIARVPKVAKTRGGSDMWDAIAIALVSAGRLRMR